MPIRPAPQLECLLMAQNRRVGRLKMTVIIEGTTVVCSPHFCFRGKSVMLNCPPKRGFMAHLRPTTLLMFTTKNRIIGNRPAKAQLHTETHSVCCYMVAR